MDENKRIQPIKPFVGILLMILVLIGFDQFTKQLAQQYLMNSNDIPILGDALVLHYLENTGAAFSMMADVPVFQGIMRVLTPLIALILLYFVYILLTFGKKYVSLVITIAFIFAGAIGNYIDRLQEGSGVIDFIYFKLIDFPVFNVADIYVTCAVIVLFLLILFKLKDDELEEIKNRMLRRS